MQQQQYERNIVIINSSHYISGSNRFVYKFPQPIQLFDCKLSVQNVAMYNSTYNISERLKNNRYSIIWIDNSRYDFVIPDGYYSLDQLNSRFQFDMTNNGLYVNLPNNNQSIQQAAFFIILSANSIRYKAQLNIYYVPNQTTATSLQYTRPSNATWTFSPNNGQTPGNHIAPQIFFNEGLLKLLGFPGVEGQNTFPSTQLTNNGSSVPPPVSFVSRLSPQVSPIFSYIFTCNLVNSNLNNVPSVMLQLALTSSFGSLITYNNASDDNKLNIRNGYYGSIELSLLDQTYQQLFFNDPDIVITLVIHSPI